MKNKQPPRTAKVVNTKTGRDYKSFGITDPNTAQPCLGNSSKNDLGKKGKTGY